MSFKDFSILVADYLGLIGISIFVMIFLWRLTKRKSLHKSAQKQLQDAINKSQHEPNSLHPVVNPALCAGCGVCTRVCPEGDILKMIDHKPVLVSPTKCVGHGECERACPFGAIDLVFGTKTRGKEIPRISGNYETNVPGLYITGELGGMGLISNAFKQGSWAAKHAVQNMSRVGQADVDLLIIGAGPSGLAASLQATELKCNYLTIEQNAFGGTIYNFPRQKLVMTRPAPLPIFGRIKFPRNKVSKEELLAAWDSIRKKVQLRIQEKTKFNSLTVENGIFFVETSRGTIRARKVILALGVGGSPRKLGVPNEDLPKVAYRLIDPEQYQRQYVTVVGGGNSALEAAYMLANPKYQNRVVLLVRKDMSKSNDENQVKVLEYEKRGLLKILYGAQISEIHQDHIIVDYKGQKGKMPNNYVFVFAGAEMPWKFLMSLGIKIEKKYGEALKRSS